MEPDEHYLQRQGYVDAFRHKDVINAITVGIEGAIAVTYMEWAGTYEPVQLVPWTLIDSAESARAFADRLEAEPLYSERLTSISSALISAHSLMMQNEFEGIRKVIDVSGDGANNTGPGVAAVRDDVVAAGITINGLPIMLNKPKEWYDIDHLDRYYKDCVIGGAGAFVAPVYDLRHFGATVRKKLVMEIAEAPEPDYPETAPVQFAEAGPAAAPADGFALTRVQLRLPVEKTDCLIGEKVWNSRGGFGGFGGFGDR
jgi:hypothetical protein